MPDIEWIKLVTAALGGGLTVKLLDIAYQELRRNLDHTDSVKQFVDEHLDPLLKAADELVGKVRSLADEDFKTLYDIDPEQERIENPDFTSLVFLIANFWASIEIIRKESSSIAIVQDKRGKDLQAFLDCLESRGVRIVDRISQRAVGELMLVRHGARLETASFIDFARKFEQDSDSKRWIAPLARILSRMRHTSERQQLLEYGVVTHALLDTLDPEHQVSRLRPSYPHKLSKKNLAGPQLPGVWTIPDLR